MRFCSCGMTSIMLCSIALLDVVAAPHGTLQGQAHAEQPGDGGVVLAGQFPRLVEVAARAAPARPWPRRADSLTADRVSVM